MRASLLFVTCLVLVLTSGCGGPTGAEGAPGSSAELAAAEIVEPPFAVRGELEGLMLTWFDAEGTHLAERRADVPPEARAEVRVDSPSLAPEARDPDQVFVADLRIAGAGGAYVVRRMSREGFEARTRAAREAAAEVASAGSGEVIVFGASWCGACRQAEAYLRQRGVPFEERDIEADPAARQDMMRRARAAGITANGIPVIDVRGRVMQGFDARAIDRALAETGGAGASPAQPGPAPGTAPGAAHDPATGPGTTI